LKLLELLQRSCCGKFSDILFSGTLLSSICQSNHTSSDVVSHLLGLGAELNFYWPYEPDRQYLYDLSNNLKIHRCGLRCRRPGAGSDGPLSTCTMIKSRKKGKVPNRSGLRDAAMSHLGYMKGATRYPLERNAGGGYLCMINDR
jgi:hypothetical protein